MQNYTPLPHDELRLGEQCLIIDRVFPTQVILHYQGNEGIVEVEREKFDKLAQGTFAKGAALFRGGEQLYPPIAEPATIIIGGEQVYPEPTPTPLPTTTTTMSAHQSGSHNTHARLSPSDSKRWTNCTASIALQEANAHRVTNNDTNESREGTTAHDWATKLLLGEIGPIDIPENFRDPVLSYTDHCQSLVTVHTTTSLQSCLDDAALGFDVPTDVVFVEEQIPLYYQEEQTGTADYIGLTAEDGVANRLYVRDYKHGAGVLVGTDKNTQLAIYAYSVVKHLSGAYTFPDDCPVDIAIVQPRHREAGEPTPWVITVADLRTFCEDIEYRAIQARTAAERVRERITTVGKNISTKEILEAAPGAVFAPSEGDSGACRWCKCKAFCSVRLAAAVEECELPSMSAEDMLACMPTLDKVESKAPVEARLSVVSEALGSQGRIITDDYLVNLVGHAKAIRSFLSDAEEYLENRLLSGEDIDGVKLVDGREGNREWANETEAETFLKGQALKLEERFDFKLKSPAKIEAVLKDKLKSSTRTKNRFEQLITRSSGKKKLAIDSDKRDAVVPAVAMMPVIADEDDFEV
jgi:hypothetical protein